MNLGVFGIGYVGCVSAACFAKDGHDVTGVDVNPTKVEIINSGHSPIVEPGIGELMHEAVDSGRLRAMTSAAEAVSKSAVSLVCVGTPSNANGSLDLRYVSRVCEEIGAALRTKTERHVVVIRSTMLPGTIQNVVVPTLEQTSGKKAGLDFGVCINPEFLREGTSLQDFYAPPFTLIGADDDQTVATVSALYRNIDAPLFKTDVKTAEMIKYVCNTFHALKVSFANEVGNICKALAIDSHAVMEIFCQDTKLNLSPYYLKPGFAFGGSCLPKDVRAITYRAKLMDVKVPIIDAILPSNDEQVERGIRAVTGKGKKKVGILGFSFKAGTDDLRESPMVELVERLIGKGYDLRVYDSHVKIAAIHGANRDYILNHIPHISKLMVGSVDEVLGHAETIVVGNGAPEFRDIPSRINEAQQIVDLVRITKERSVEGVYDGLCW